MSSSTFLSALRPRDQIRALACRVSQSVPVIRTRAAIDCLVREPLGISRPDRAGRETVVIPPDGETLERFGGATAAALGGGTEPGTIDVLVWNLQKGDSEGWQREFARRTGEADLVLGQEATTKPESVKAYSGSGHRWDMAVSYIDPGWFGATGVITGSRAAPDRVAFVRSSVGEPIVGSPKITCVTRYPLAGTSQSLVVANTHGLNISSSGPLERQLAAVVEVLESHEGPLLWAGDFNTWTPQRLAVARAAAARLGLREVHTSNGSPWLDRAFVRGLTVESARLCDPFRHSDHRGLRIRLRVGEQVSKLARLHALLTADDVDERQILALLESATAKELDHIVRHLDLPTLLDRVDRPAPARQLHSLLTEERLADLSVEARALLIDALQRGRTSHEEELAATRIFVGTTGADLTRLKDLVNLGSNPRDLEHLLWHDIDSEQLRQRILQHIAREGSTPLGERKLLSDIDDTFASQVRDERFPKGAVYPGVNQFHAELDRGRSGKEKTGDLIFLTASPQSIEWVRHRWLSDRGVPDRAMASGGLRYMHSAAAQAKKKLVNYARLCQLYPEYDFLFVGDSGGADVLVARQLAGQLPLLIHDIGNLSAEQRAELGAAGIGTFSTYVGAAVLCVRYGLLSKEAAWRIARAARTEIEAIPFEDEAQRDYGHMLLARDIGELEDLFEADGNSGSK